MTKFQKERFSYFGGYLSYEDDYKESRFVARFKYRGPVKKSDFVRLLTKYYTVEDYFDRIKTKAPLQIFMDDGFVLFDTTNHKVLVAR
jgi:hypothetical protein